MLPIVTKVPGLLGWAAAYGRSGQACRRVDHTRRRHHPGRWQSCTRPAAAGDPLFPWSRSAA